MSTIADQLATLKSSDPETRASAADWLGKHGDGCALATLERMVIEDTGQFSIEGAFVDHVGSVQHSAADALEALYQRVTLTPADEARIMTVFPLPFLKDDINGHIDRSLHLLNALGAKARPLAERALTDANPFARLRGHMVLGWLDRKPRWWWFTIDDEEVRYAATQQRHQYELVGAAVDRFPLEPSVRVRRGIADLWLRYRLNFGTWSEPYREAADMFLADPDPEIQACAAKGVAKTR